MKTVLTLKSGSFFFLHSLQLTREVPQEIDLDNLSPKEFLAVQLYTASGHLESSETLPETLDMEVKLDTPAVAEEPANASQEVSEATVESAEEATDPYEGMTKKELQALIEERGIETKATSIKGLTEALKDWDAEQTQAE